MVGSAAEGSRVSASSQQNRTAPPDHGRREGARDRILRTVFERFPRQAQEMVIGLAHEEYEGRNVVSIVVRDEYDDLEAVTYYDQPVFARHRHPPGMDGDARDAN